MVDQYLAYCEDKIILKKDVKNQKISKHYPEL